MKESAFTSYDELPLMLSVPDLCRALGISRAGAYELVRKEDFPSFNIGSRIFTPKDKFIAWIDAKTSKIE